MTRRQLCDEYFEWIFDIVCRDRYAEDNSYRNLLSYLHSVDFSYIISRDQDRYTDGVDLRRKFTLEMGYGDTAYRITGPCSVLEMMVALAIRCEETIMDDVTYGDRTGQWFWSMIVSLGLGSMSNRRFDVDYVEEVIDTFLNRDYEPDGRGGLFTIRDCDDDLRRVDIWGQMCWYLDEYYAY